MKVRIITFTNKGYELGARLQDLPGSYDCELIYKGKQTSISGCTTDEKILTPDGLPDICRTAFEQSISLVFIGAAGIAVRSVAPYVRDKLTDPPVIVIDELGRFVIPVLSGHVGGANELACRIADAIGAEPVITTATDINETFAVDVFAKENGLTIRNREGIAKVSSSALEGRPVTISIKDYPPAEPVDVIITDEPGGINGDMTILNEATALKNAASIILCPKIYAIGIGCRRGKTFEELRDFARGILEDNGISTDDVGCIATIDVKKDEEGLRRLSQAWRMPLVTYEASVLARANSANGEFASSETVLEKVGVDNVCERAAVIAAGPGSELIVRKTASNGMTVAVAGVNRVK